MYDDDDEQKDFEIIFLDFEPLLCPGMISSKISICSNPPPCYLNKDILSSLALSFIYLFFFFSNCCCLSDPFYSDFPILILQLSTLVLTPPRMPVLCVQFYVRSHKCLAAIERSVDNKSTPYTYGYILLRSSIYMHTCMSTVSSLLLHLLY